MAVLPRALYSEESNCCNMLLVAKMGGAPEPIAARWTIVSASSNLSFRHSLIICEFSHHQHIELYMSSH
eukprot:7047485-Heterocapsa_arctica.AAC.1